MLRDLFSDLSYRLHVLFKRATVERELDEELKLHIERDTEARVRAGASPDEARRAARLAFGGVEQIKEVSRDGRGLHLLDQLSQDLRYGFRSLRRAPAFTVTAVLTLALGLGASIAVFSVVNAVYFSALPYRDPARLVMIETNHSGPKCTPLCETGISARELSDWTSRLDDVASIAVMDESGGTVYTREGPRIYAWANVSANFFVVAGLQPLLGRALIPADDQPGAERVAVLSYAYWQDQFGGDSTAVGGQLQIADSSYRIVGVMPPSAAIGLPLFKDQDAAPFFLPLGSTAPNSNETFGTVVGRLKLRATAEQLRVRVAALAAVREPGPREAPLADGTRPKWRAEVTGIRESYARAYAGSYTLFLAMVLAVLFIACANLAGLFLARLSARRQEIAMRAALGAGRGRLLRQLLMESGLIAGAACVVGLLLAHWGVRLSRLLPAAAVPYWAPIGVDARVTVFALGLAAACALAFGLGPALLLTRGGSTLGIRDVSRAFAGGRAVTITRRLLVSAQIAIALILITGAGLLGKTFFDAMTRDMGFAKHAVLVGDYINPRGLWTPQQETALLDELVDRVERLPGVEAVGGYSAGSAMASTAGVTREGDTEMVPSTIVHAALAVTPGYFSAMRMPILRGRAFTDADNAGVPPVLILGDSAAHRLYPHGDAVGRRIKFGPPTSDAPWVTVVGVVRSPHCATTSVTCPYSLGVFSPVAQGLVPFQGFRLGIRAHDTRGAEALIPAVQAAAHDLGPSIVTYQLRTIESFLDRQLAPLRVNTAVLGAFAIFALALAALGVYSVLAYLVAQRTTEIGIRMALGATGADVRRLILRSVAGMTTFGVVVGAAASFGLTRLLRSMLYTTSATDPRVFVGAALLLASAAVAAALIPARRASQVDPVIAMRTL